ncbi:MAG: hypothetical protein M0P27_01580 [Bacteroidales bacterium]|nr:hypothetical protein [Bacteroidales bacterium]
MDANKVLKQFLSHLVPVRVYLFFAKRVFARSACNNNLSGSVHSDWDSRIADVLSAPDNLRIERVADAGKISGNTITMHNGVKVFAGSYYGDGMLELLIKNRGVHEPQEELIFSWVIDTLPENCTMVELGAYWSFYSLSLLKKRPNAMCWMVEPVKRNLASGILNFKLNECNGVFVNAGVGAAPSRFPRVVSVDALCKDHGIDILDVLHADIQGQELNMLRGAVEMLSNNMVKWLFISTHSDLLHDGCVKHLSGLGYVIVSSVKMDQSYSYDGLIVAKSPAVQGLDNISISLKSRENMELPC